MKDEPKTSDTIDVVRVIADRSLVLALIVGGVVAAALGHGDLAGQLIAGALGALIPLGRLGAAARALPLALGIGAGAALGAHAQASEPPTHTPAAVEAEAAAPRPARIVFGPRARLRRVLGASAGARIVTATSEAFG